MKQVANPFSTVTLGKYDNDMQKRLRLYTSRVACVHSMICSCMYEY